MKAAPETDIASGKPEPGTGVEHVRELPLLPGGRAVAFGSAELYLVEGLNQVSFAEPAQRKKLVRYPAFAYSRDTLGTADRSGRRLGWIRMGDLRAGTALSQSFEWAGSGACRRLIRAGTELRRRQCRSR